MHTTNTEIITPTLEKRLRRNSRQKKHTRQNRKEKEEELHTGIAATPICSVRNRQKA
jgi:hypothetical protein